MSFARHRYSPREVGFFVEAALSPLSVSSIEWDDKSGNVEIRYAANPLASLRGIAEWVSFVKPGATGVFNVPAGTRKVAIECTSHDPDDPSVVTVVTDGLTNMEQARIYGVDRLTLPPGPPSNSLIHWFDFADEQTVYQDVAGTQPAQDGDPIRRVNNKGSDPTPLTSASDATSPTFHQGVVNGQSVARLDDPSERLFNVIPNGVDGTVNGMTLAGIVRPISADADTILNFNWNGSDVALEIDGTLGTSIRLYLGGNSIAPITGFTLDNWYLVYVALNTGFSWDYYGSPGPEGTGFNGANPVVPVNAVMELITGLLDVEVAELFVYSESLLAPTRSGLVTYSNTKYGMLPHA